MSKAGGVGARVIPFRNSENPSKESPWDGKNPLEKLAFRYPLRKYQTEILDLVKDKLGKGERELHIVAPPGAGKTIIGLQLIAELQRPSLILSPNTTIQSQWGQKLHNFLPIEETEYGVSEIIGTHHEKPLKPITLLTYQVLSTPGREQEYLEKLAHKSWVDELTSGRKISIGDAELRILDLLQNNPKAHGEEVSRHVSRLRKRLTEVLDLKDVLHPNAIELLQSLRRQKFGVVIFDECHHLTDYWAAVMTHLVQHLEDPIIIGLTGTPPEGKTASQETRYLSLVGDIDYQVPTPALVREGGLAPFQDLVYFTEPTEKEFEFLEQQHKAFHDLLLDLTAPVVSTDADTGEVTKTDSELTTYVRSRLEQALIPRHTEISISSHNADSKAPPPSQGAHIPKIKGTGDGEARMRVTKADLAKQRKQKEQEQQNARDALIPEPSITNPFPVSQTTRLAQDAWRKFAEQRPTLSTALCRYLWRMEIPFPRAIDSTEALRQSPLLEDWMQVLEDFASQKLKLSAKKEDHALYDKIRAATRALGYNITEQGLRKQASPVDRVLAFSSSKPTAVAKILDIEYKIQESRLRAVVVTDFEHMSATSAKQLKGVLDEESGGAVAALRILLADPIGEMINPCLVTGGLLLTDKRVTAKFVEAAEEYLKKEGLNIKLIVNETPADGFSEITAGSANWESRLYVGLATEIFERGITKCLIGTRGLFGEGWDSQALNTLIDLTTTTSAVSVKQLRGRSIRIQTNDPLGARKVANNWDVVCVAPQLEKGLNDYQRFVRKHENFFGICDDGQIECGVGHIHPAFSELTPVEVFASAEKFNLEMIDRALIRDQIYDLWKVGQPYKNRTLGCIELTRLRKLALTPPNIRKNITPQEHAAELRSELKGIWIEHTALGAVASVATALVLSALGGPLAIAWVPLVISLGIGRKRFTDLYNRIKADVCRPNSQDSSLRDIAVAVLTALQKIKLIPQNITRENIRISLRSDGSYRLFLDDVEAKQSKYFTDSFSQVMAPISNQPYLIPKYEYFMGAPEDTPPNKLEQNQNQDQSDNIKIHPRVLSTINNGAFVPTPPPSARPDGLGEAQKEEWDQHDARESRFFRSYLRGNAEPRVVCHHAVPNLLGRSERGREAFQASWNKYVSPGFIVATETKPELLDKYYGLGPSLAQRLLWE